MNDSELIPWWRRIGLAFGVFFRILFDGVFAGKLKAWSSGAPTEERKSLPPEAPIAAPPQAAAASPEELAGAAEAGAVILLGLMQAEGRFIDFVQQDLTGFEDAEIGAVARIVHKGCSKVLHDYLEIEPIRSEPEGQNVSLPAGFDPSQVKLTGNLGAGDNVQGVLRHKGWRAASVRLPRLVDARGAYVLCPAEIEL